MTTLIPRNQAAFTLAEVVEATGGRLRHSTHPGVGLVLGVSIDTRSLEPGSLFVALRGATIDGHDYLAQAAELPALEHHLGAPAAPRGDGAQAEEARSLRRHGQARARGFRALARARGA